MILVVFFLVYYFLFFIKFVSIYIISFMISFFSSSVYLFFTNLGTLFYHFHYFNIISEYFFVIIFFVFFYLETLFLHHVFHFPSDFIFDINIIKLFLVYIKQFFSFYPQQYCFCNFIYNERSFFEKWTWKTKILLFVNIYSIILFITQTGVWTKFTHNPKFNQAKQQSGQWCNQLLAERVKN